MLFAGVGKVVEVGRRRFANGGRRAALREDMAIGLTADERKEFRSKTDQGKTIAELTLHPLAFAENPTKTRNEEKRRRKARK